MKKKILTMVLLCAAAVLLTACGNTPADSSDTETLTIMGKATDVAKGYMTSIFEQYESATGNKLNIVAVEDSEFETTLAEKFAGGELPDILMHFNNSDLEKYNIEDNFYYLNDESWIADLTEGSKAYCQDSDGNILGLPFWESSVSGCYYNKTILDGLGLRPASTQAEFDVLCQALKDVGYTPICMPADGCSWMYQFGLDPVFADTPSLLEELNANRITYADIPAVTDMVQWIADAAEKGWFGNSYLDTGWDDISPVLSSGEAVMVYIWDTWFYTDFKEDGQYSKEDFALMPVFMNTADNGTYEGGNLNMMMVNKNSARLENALDFLSFCASSDHYNEAFDGVSTVSCFKGQTTNIQSAMVTDAMPSINKNQRVSTAEPKIIGYHQDDAAAAFKELLQKNVDTAGCIELLDGYRIEAAKALGRDGF